MGGGTFKKILEVLDELGYDVTWKVYNSKDYDVPQNRERVFIKGCFRGRGRFQVLFKPRANRKVISKVDGKMSKTYWGTRQGRIHKEDEIMNTLACNGHNSGASQLIQVNNDKKRSQGDRGYDSDGLAVTINAAGNNNWYTVNERKINKVNEGNHQRNNVYDTNGLSPTLTATDYKGPQKIVQPVLTPDRAKKRQNGRRMKENDEPMFTLTAQDKHEVYDGYSVRKLTPVECERLQGFEDNWTKYGKDDELISDTQRYKCCGNAVTTNVITAIVDEMFEGVV